MIFESSAIVVAVWPSVTTCVRLGADMIASLSPTVPVDEGETAGVRRANDGVFALPSSGSGAAGA